MRSLSVPRSLPRRVALLGAVALLVPGAAATASAASAPMPPGAADAAVALPPVPAEERLQPWLAQRLSTPSEQPLRVMIGGQTTSAAIGAARAAGLTVSQTWDKVATVVATGTQGQVRAVVGQPGVRYVEGDKPLTYALDTAHLATRSEQALAEYRTRDGSRLDGTGVSVAVIDSGIDGTHPFFADDSADRSKVVANLEHVCGNVIGPSDDCFQQEPTNNTDANSFGGHGTHVAGIVAGSEVTTSSPAGTRLRGAAPGASLVGLSMGLTVTLINSSAAMNWVLEHHRNPCGTVDEQDVPPDPDCPPIRATNHSYGPLSEDEEGTSFEDAPAVTVELQRALVSEGITPVWAAGNSGGNGGVARTNPPGMDPTPGVLLVASYDDGGTGTREGRLSQFSSRGRQGDTATYPDLSAPGELITSSCRPELLICRGTPAYDGGNYQSIGGTSMAAPYVAGVVAQLAQAAPTITPAGVENLLEDTAHKFGAGYEPDPGRNDDDETSFDKGHGLVDVLAAVGVLSPVFGPGPQPTQPPATAQPQPRTLDAACPPGRVPASSQTDDNGNFHERAINCVVWWEIALGRSSTDYDPEVAVSREQMASFVARLVQQAGGSLPSNPRNAFSDDDTSRHHDNINKLAQAGLVDGKGDGRFAPRETVTRAQMAKFIVNAYEYVSPNSLATSNDYFGDDEGDVLEDFINRSAAAGFTAGRNGRYEPRLPVLRDQMASFLARPLDLLVAEGTTPPHS